DGDGRVLQVGTTLRDVEAVGGTQGMLPGRVLAKVFRIAPQMRRPVECIDAGNLRRALRARSTRPMTAADLRVFFRCKAASCKARPFAS
ncbi:MAG TPA: hypothetical protein VFE67_12720, partial [Rudaea sp.]|nr:hypothetical protein [Rudaea sp.]